MSSKGMIKLFLLAALVFTIGCGDKTDRDEQILELQKKSIKEIDDLKAKHKAQINSYEQKLSYYEGELTLLREELTAKEKLLGKAKAVLKPAPKPIKAVERKRPEEKATKAAEAIKTPKEVVDLAEPTPVGMDYTLESFVDKYEASIGESSREQYRKDFDTFVAQLKEQSKGVPALKRKEKMLQDLQGKIDSATGEREAEQLEARMKKIENASETDLAGVLDYYQELDNIQELNQLMEKYNIPRARLIEEGIMPPPRSSWRPNMADIAYSLESFVERYEPLTGEEQRDQYKKDFSDYIDSLTTTLSDKQVLQRRDQMLVDLQARYETASDREKRRLDRRMRRLEDSDMDRLRRRMQYDQLRDLNDLAEKYNIPISELRQSGVRVRRRRRTR